jgi:hypothetical protein
VAGDVFDIALQPATYDLVLLGHLSHLFDGAPNGDCSSGCGLPSGTAADRCRRRDAIARSGPFGDLRRYAPQA